MYIKVYFNDDSSDRVANVYVSIKVYFKKITHNMKVYFNDDLIILH